MSQRFGGLQLTVERTDWRESLRSLNPAKLVIRPSTLPCLSSVTWSTTTRTVYFEPFGTVRLKLKSVRALIGSIMRANLKIRTRIGVQQDYIGYHLKKSGLNIYKSNESIEGNLFKHVTSLPKIPKWIKCRNFVINELFSSKWTFLTKKIVKNNPN